MTDKPLINRVANSGIKTINLEDYFPKREMVLFDLKPFLFKELLLKEKDFRIAMKELDWTAFEDKILLIDCTSDAIIPVWAYMLVATHAKPYASEIFQGSEIEFLKRHFERAVESIDASNFEQDRVVIKGCSDKPVPPSAYAAIASKLQPVVQSLMYGEPCSTVPIFKRPRVLNKG